MNYLNDYTDKQRNEITKYLIGKEIKGMTFVGTTWRYVLETGVIIEYDTKFIYSSDILENAVDRVTGAKVKEIKFTEDLCLISLDNGMGIRGDIDIDFILTEVPAPD